VREQSKSALPQGMSIRDPACLISTWFGVGLLPVAPGTWGSAAALPFAWFLQLWGGPLAVLTATAIIFVFGWWAVNGFIAKSEFTDPAPVVIDEVAGQWLVLAFVPPSYWYYIIGFAIFRVLDICKPWPAGWADRELHGGLGVMLDDVFAAVYGATAMYVLVLLTGGANVFA
jgi:phosphatidylglycerophosphatase A